MHPSPAGRRHPRPRGLASVLALVFASCVAGCTPLSGPGRPSAAAGTPTPSTSPSAVVTPPPGVGSCLTLGSLAYYRIAETPTVTVPCTRPHQLEVFTVTSLPRPIGTSGAVMGVTAESDARLWKLCDDPHDRASAFLGDTFPWYRNVWTIPVTASSAEVGRGSTWVACALAQPATFARTGTDPKTYWLGTRRASLHAAMSRSRNALHDFGICRSDHSTSRQVYACSRDTELVHVGVVRLSSAPARYPAGPTLDALALRACRPLALRQSKEHDATYDAESPDARSWAEGDRAVDCWLQLSDLRPGAR